MNHNTNNEQMFTAIRCRISPLFHYVTVPESWFCSSIWLLDSGDADGDVEGPELRVVVLVEVGEG